MQPRRRREPKHFLKVILPSAIHGNQMRIPEEFIARYGDKLSTVATITVPDGRVWKMRLKKCGKDVLFCNQWSKFVKYYSISYGSCLVFRYEGNSKFRVLIFDTTSAEICYPCKPGKKESSSREKQVKIECSENHSYLEIANVAANEFKPKNPSYTATIRHNRLYVGAEFAAKYLKPHVDMKLQNCNGKQWTVSCVSFRSGTRAVVIGKGWTKFLRDNDLSEGDCCVLELIKSKPAVLSVTVFPAAQNK